MWSRRGTCGWGQGRDRRRVLHGGYAGTAWVDAEWMRVEDIMRNWW